MKKITIVGVLVVVGLIWFFMKGPTGQQVSTLDPIDVAGDFYNQWLKAEQEPTAEPNQATLANSPILSESLRTRLVSTERNPDTTPDPVLCQTVAPKGISIRTIIALEDEVQILILSKDKAVTEQAVFTLLKLNEGWYIDNIECSPGEFAPEREFSFEMEGNLLKGSVPAPYNSKDWHLVFTQNGQAGNVVPMFFDSESECTKLDGTKATCNPAELTEATKVFVRGQMSERGVSVKRLEFVK